MKRPTFWNYITLGVIGLSLTLLSERAQSDAYTYLQNGTMIESQLSIATAGSTTALTYQSPTNIELTGTLAQTVTLPSAFTIPNGRRFNVVNASTGIVTLKDYGGTTLATLPPQVTYTVVLTTRTVSAGTWQVSGAASQLFSLSDVVISSPASGQYLGYNGSAWANAAFPTASSSITGFLSSTDWSTFNGKAGLTSTAPSSVATTNGLGSATDAAKADHTHQGVHSIASGASTLYGDVTLTAGTNVTITPSGQTLTIASTASGGGGTASSLNTIEAITEQAKVNLNYIPTSLTDYIGEAFIDDVTNRVTTSNLTQSISSHNVSLSSTNLTGTAISEIGLQNAKASLPINWSARFNTGTTFIASGISTTQTTLSNSAGPDRYLEVYGGSGTSVGWFCHQSRSVNTLPWVNSDNCTRVTISAASGASDITVTHSAITQIPAPTTTSQYVFVMENANPISFQIAGGGYNTSTPSTLKMFDIGLSYYSGVQSHWRLDETAGNSVNIRQPGGAYDLTQVGTVPSAAGKILRARGNFSGSNYLTWYAGGSQTTVFDSQTFIWDMWIKHTSGGYGLVSKPQPGTSNYGYYCYATTNIVCYVGSGGGNNSVQSTAGTYGDGNWHHVVFAKICAGACANGIRLYVDGSLVSSTTSFAMAPYSSDLYVGMVPSQSGYVGLIDDLAFANVTPSTTTDMDAYVTSRYSLGLGRTFGAYFGYLLTGTLAGQNASLGDLFQMSVGLRREDTTTNPTIEAYNASF
jgi:hypothetical protein